MSKITGIGGVFIEFKGEESKVKEWYSMVYKLKMSDMGTSFSTGEQLALFTFKARKDTPLLVNFRVDNVKEALEDAVANMGKVHSEIEENPFGKFAQIEDPFGNVVELWEANEEGFKKMMG